MFGFRKNKAEAQAACQGLLDDIRPEVERLISAAADPAGKALAEFHGTLYYAWLARSRADWKAIRTHLAGHVLDSLRVTRISEAERKKLPGRVRRYWHALEKAEARLLRQGKNPLRWLDDHQSGFPGLALQDPDFGKCLLTVTGDLILRLDLIAYANYAIAPEAPSEKAPKQALPLSDPRPQPPRAPEYVHMTNAQGESVRLRLLDVIVTVNGAFACLIGEGETELMVLRTTGRPDGSTAYSPAPEADARLVYAIFKTRNPQFFQHA